MNKKNYFIIEMTMHRIENVIKNSEFLEKSFENVKKVLYNNGFKFFFEIEANELIDYCCNGRTIMCEKEDIAVTVKTNLCMISYYGRC